MHHRVLGLTEVHLQLQNALVQSVQVLLQEHHQHILVMGGLALCCVGSVLAVFRLNSLLGGQQEVVQQSLPEGLFVAHGLEYFENVLHVYLGLPIQSAYLPPLGLLLLHLPLRTGLLEEGTHSVQLSVSVLVFEHELSCLQKREGDLPQSDLVSHEGGKEGFQTVQSDSPEVIHSSQVLLNGMDVQWSQHMVTLQSAEQVGRVL